jgi:hypothetical protein
MATAVDPPDALSAIPPGLRDPLLEEYRTIVQNFLEQRWLPTELSGGRFSEIVYTILPNHMDSVAVLSMANWIMAELVRVVHNLTTISFCESIEFDLPFLMQLPYRTHDVLSVLFHPLDYFLRARIGHAGCGKQ